MEIAVYEVTPFIVNCFVLTEGNEAIVIDPGEGSPRLLQALEGLNVKQVINTHCHCDHCGGNAAVLAQTGAKLGIHKDDLPLLRSIEIQGQMFGVTMPPSPDPDFYLVEGDTITVGESVLKVLHTPGHSPGHIVLLGADIAFVGDVLFAGSIGRTDLPGGNYHQLMQSIKDKILSLPDNIVAYPGHGPETTIGQERRSNPFLVDL
jgi:glyoxylase-like metal-dependent hydrolase (beta-lactamase superfamily II)